VQGFNLAADLVGCANALERLGQLYSDNPESLLRLYASRCSPELDDRWIRNVLGSAQRRNCCPSVPIEKLLSRAQWWQRQVCG
jgi:hypothetical protein